MFSSNHCGDWPAELHCVVANLREAIGGAAAAPPRDIDWTAWLSWVERHRVAAFLHARLSAPTRAQQPRDAAASLAVLARSAVLRSLANARDLATVLTRLRSGGINAIALKGAAVAQQIYGDVGARASGDVDCLVAPHDAAAADRLLRDAGWRRVSPDFELTPSQSRHFLSRYTFNYVHAEHVSTLELHTGLVELPRLSLDALWHGRERVTLAGCEIAALPSSANAVYLCAHGAKHAWASLHWLVDVALLLRGADAAARSDMHDVAARNGATRPLLQAERLASVLLDTPTTSTPQHAKYADAGTAAGRVVRESMGRKSARAPLLERLRFHAYSLRMQETWRGRVLMAARLWLLPADWGDVRLPDRWFWLYYALRPVLWGFRRCRAVVRR